GQVPALFTVPGHQRIGTGSAVSSPDTATTSASAYTSARAGELALSGSAARASRIRAHSARPETPATRITLASSTRPYAVSVSCARMVSDGIRRSELHTPVVVM